MFNEFPPFVAIIGGGPVGLSLAIELGQQRVPCILIEQNAHTAQLPKANFINVRSMEIFRRNKVRDQVRQHSLADQLDNNVVFGTRLKGHYLARMLIPSLAESERLRQTWRADPKAVAARMRHLPREFHDRLKVSAEFGQRTPQDHLEPVLRRAAEAHHPGRILFGHKLLNLTQQDDGVQLRILDQKLNRTFDITVPYVAACDGASSPIRKSLEIRMLGEQLPSTQIAIYFDSPELSEHLKQYGGVAQFFIVNPINHGVLVWSGGDRYVLHAVTEKPEELARTPDEWISILSGGSFSYRLIAHGPWKANLLTAERYRKGRVFLAGDAAHLVPPTGGFGMNTGLQDALDLAWKVGAVYHGWGGQTLLDSYDAERQQAFQHFHRECSHNLAQLDVRRIPKLLEKPGLLGVMIRRATAGMINRRQRKRTNFATSVFGYHYQGSPVLPDVANHESTKSAYYNDRRGKFAQVTAVGYRAPHRWLNPPPKNEEVTSQIRERCVFDDFLVDGFTLLVKTHSSASAQALVDAAMQLNIPLKVLELSGDILGAEYDHDLTLIRPDQHVAWLGNRVPEDSQALWMRLTGRKHSEHLAPPTYSKQRADLATVSEGLGNYKDSIALV